MRWTGKVSAAPATGTLAARGRGEDVAHRCGSVGSWRDRCHATFAAAQGHGPRSYTPADVLAAQHQALPGLRRRGPLRDAGRRQPRSRDLHRSARRSTTRTRSTSSARCRSGTTRCCSAGATSSRATACGPCRPASWSSARRPSRARCARPIEEAGARVELQGLFTLLNVVRVGQVHLFYRARLLDTDFAPGPETIEARLFARRPRFPGTRSPSGRRKLTLERYFDDRRAGAGFGVHTLAVS